MLDRFDEPDWQFARRLHGEGPPILQDGPEPDPELMVGDWVLDLRHGSRSGAILAIYEIPNVAGLVVQSVTVAWNNNSKRTLKMSPARLQLLRRFHVGDPVVTPDGPGVVTGKGDASGGAKIWVKQHNWPGSGATIHPIQTIHHERQPYKVGDIVRHKEKHWRGRVSTMDCSTVRVFGEDGIRRLVLRPSLLIKCFNV